MSDQNGVDLYDQSQYPPPPEPQSGPAKFLGLGTVPLVIAAVAAVVLVAGVAFIAINGTAAEDVAATPSQSPATAIALTDFEACEEALDQVLAATDAFNNGSAIAILDAKAGLEALAAQSPELAPLLASPIAALSKDTVSGSEFATAIQPVMDRCEAVVAAAAADAEPVPAPAAGTIEEGDWAVGVDVAPGTYRTDAPVVDGCYWAIYKAGTNQEDIINNGNPTGGYPTVVLKKGQEFTNQGCGTFVK